MFVCWLDCLLLFPKQTAGDTFNAPIQALMVRVYDLAKHLFNSKRYIIIFMWLQAAAAPKTWQYPPKDTKYNALESL